MAIVYTKLLRLLKERQISFYRLKKSADIAEGTMNHLRKNCSVSTETLNRVCRALHCQPGDIMEYIEDEAEP